jgi:hypothetical protein
MKNSHLLLGLFAAALISGSAAASQPLVLESVGPDTTRHSAESATGVLMVFSGVEIQQSNDPSNDVRHHTSYEIWSADGSQRLQTIRNYSLPGVDQGPTPVTLAPGHYLVKAMANTYSSVHIPVVVAAHRTTTLHLDNDPRKRSQETSAGLVRLPDGSVVGSRASS